MRRALWTFAALFAAAMLTACGTTGTTPPPPSGPGGDSVDATVTAEIGTGATLSNQDPVASFTLAPGEDRLYRVRVPSSSEPALYVYLNRNWDLGLYDRSGSLYATSSSSAYFAESDLGLDGASVSGVTPQVVEAQLCPGSCIIRENPGAVNQYVRVLNDSGTRQSYTLWATLTDFDDTNEAEATFSDPASLEDSAEGAIETLGDEDYFIVDALGTSSLEFDYFDDVGTGLELVAEIVPFDQGQPSRFVRPGGTAIVEFSDTIVVYAENEDLRAAASGNSQYFLNLE